jgi:hypothetical protein
MVSFLVVTQKVTGLHNPRIRIIKFRFSDSIGTYGQKNPQQTSNVKLMPKPVSYVDFCITLAFHKLYLLFQLIQIRIFNQTQNIIHKQKRTQ